MTAREKALGEALQAEIEYLAEKEWSGWRSRDPREDIIGGPCCPECDAMEADGHRVCRLDQALAKARTALALPHEPREEGSVSEAEIAELGRLEREATPGPWEADASVTPNAMDRRQAKRDADLIAASRNAMPRLLSEIRRLRGQR